MTTTSIPVAAFRYSADGTQAIAESTKVRASVGALDKLSLGGVNGQLATFTSSLSGMIPLLTAGAFITFAKGAIDAADAVGDAADRIGISASSLSRLKFAAEQNDVEFTELTSSLRKYQVGLSDAARGQGSAIDGLNALGLTARTLRSVRLEDQLGLIADQFSRVSDPSDRARIATDLFGKSGTALIPILSKGAAGLRELTAEADRLGITLDDRATRALDRNAKALDRALQATKSFFSNGVGSAAADIFGSGDELLDIQDKYDGLIAQRKFFEAGIQTGSSSARIKELSAEIDALLPKLQRLQILNGQSFSTDDRRRPARQPKSELEEIDLTSFQEFDAALRARTDARVKEIERGFNQERAIREDMRGVFQQIDQGTESSRVEAERRITSEVNAQLQQRAEASQNVRQFERDQQIQLEEDLFAVRQRGALAAQSLLTAYGGKYKTFAKGILAIEKAHAIASAIMDTHAAVMKTMKAYPAPYNYALAAGIIAYGAAQVAAIASTALGGNSAPSLGAPHNPVFTEPSAASTETPAQPDKRISEIHIHGSVYSNRETAEWFLQQLSEAVNERDTVIISPTSRQAQELQTVRP